MRNKGRKTGYFAGRGVTVRRCRIVSRATDQALFFSSNASSSSAGIALENRKPWA